MRGISLPKLIHTTAAPQLQATNRRVIASDFKNAFMLTIQQAPEDRVALVRAVIEGSGKFFFGN